MATLHDAPSDDTLSAWLDGELDPASRAAVDAWLADHPEDAARVRLWAADRDALRARLAPAAEEPVPDRLERLTWGAAPATSAPQGWQRVAAAVAVFALGAALGAGAMSRLQDGPASTAAEWEQRALLAHAVYVPEVRHPVEVSVAGKTPADSRAQEEHLARWLTKRIDRPVKLFDLRGQGYELVGGRLLPDDAAGPCAQLMYERSGEADPQRVTVYLRKPDSNTPAAFRYERQGDLGAFYWVEGTTGYALVGAMPREQLLGLAEAVYKQVEGGAKGIGAR
jgi:anti-sigma factor RsiW